ncbi:hypothetical protein SRHO_G00255580 [Serrasalmus rhombeus]
MGSSTSPILLCLQQWTDFENHSRTLEARHGRPYDCGSEFGRDHKEARPGRPPSRGATDSAGSSCGARRCAGPRLDRSGLASEPRPRLTGLCRASWWGARERQADAE